MEPRPGPVPESQAVASFVVYRRSDGVIVHTHHVIVLPGAEEPRAEAMIAEAVELAGSVAGAQDSDVDVLQVEATELRPGASYAVDVQERRLLVVPGGRTGRDPGAGGQAGNPRGGVMPSLRIQGLRTMNQSGMNAFLFDPFADALSLTLDLYASPELRALPEASFTAEFQIVDVHTHKVVTSSYSSVRI